MTRREKLIKKFLERPESLRFREIERILFWLGFEKLPVSSSHHKFVYRGCGLFLNFPVHGGDCKDIYKKIALRKILFNELLK